MKKRWIVLLSLSMAFGATATKNGKEAQNKLHLAQQSRLDSLRHAEIQSLDSTFNLYQDSLALFKFRAHSHLDSGFAAMMSNPENEWSSKIRDSINLLLPHCHTQIDTGSELLKEHWLGLYQNAKAQLSISDSLPLLGQDSFDSLFDLRDSINGLIIDQFVDSISSSTDHLDEIQDACLDSIQEGVDRKLDQVDHVQALRDSVQFIGDHSTRLEFSTSFMSHSQWLGRDDDLNDRDYEEEIVLRHKTGLYAGGDLAYIGPIYPNLFSYGALELGWSFDVNSWFSGELGYTYGVSKFQVPGDSIFTVDGIALAPGSSFRARENGHSLRSLVQFTSEYVSFQNETDFQVSNPQQFFVNPVLDLNYHINSQWKLTPEFNLAWGMYNTFHQVSAIETAYELDTTGYTVDKKGVQVPQTQSVAYQDTTTKEKTKKNYGVLAYEISLPLSWKVANTDNRISLDWIKPVNYLPGEAKGPIFNLSIQSTYRFQLERDPRMPTHKELEILSQNGD